MNYQEMSIDELKAQQEALREALQEKQSKVDPEVAEVALAAYREACEHKIEVEVDLKVKITLETDEAYFHTSNIDDLPISMSDVEVVPCLMVTVEGENEDINRFVQKAIDDYAGDCEIEDLQDAFGDLEGKFADFVNTVNDGATNTKCSVNALLEAIGV